MGATESKGAISPPETPQYLKYSHLRELEDPRSPRGSGEPRTPILTVDDQKKLIDPRSPSSALPRTPIFCIPEPEDESVKEEEDFHIKDESNTDEIVEISEPKVDTAVAPLADLEKIAKVEAPPSVESSPEKNPKVPEFSDKGYLIKKPKASAGTKKRRRRRKPKNTENAGIVVIRPKVEKKQAGQGQNKNQPPRSPLVTRNYIPVEENESPSLELLIKNTKKLSLNGKPRAIDFSDVENLGKENLAATFSP